MTRMWRWMATVGMSALMSAPVLAQETPTEREAAKGVLQQMGALEAAIERARAGGGAAGPERQA